MKKTRVVVLGGLGRLGSAIVNALTLDPDFEVKGIVDHKKRPHPRGLGKAPVIESLKDLKGKTDVVIDVTGHESVADHLSWVAKTKTPYILAVTGLDGETQDKVYEVAKKAAVVIAPNLSVGAAVLNEATRVVAKLFPEADIEIVEAHHRGKKDAPSGTALALAGTILMAEPKKRQKVILGHSQKGVADPHAVYVQSIRGGDVVGEHDVMFLADGERVVLRHVAMTRGIFAKGAVRAARFIAKKKPGIYSMQDVLSLGKG